MPTLNAAVSPVASITPQTGNTGLAATTEGQPATPFATVLQEQLADPGAAATDEALATDAAAQLSPAQLSQLFGANELAQWIAANMAQGSAAKARQNDDEQASTAPVSMLGLLTVPVAVPADPAINAAAPAAPGTKVASDVIGLIGARAAVAPEGNAAADIAGDTSRPGGFSALADTPAKGANGNSPATAPTAAPPAIVAASADAIAIATKPDTKSSANTESILAPNRDPNMTAVAATTIAPPPPVASRNEVTATPRIATAVGAAGWDAEVGNHVAWMANHQQGRADLVLTPPQLGRIEISLSVNGDQANAFFASANPAVREALEGSLPRLREILADAGITLGQAQVGSESPGQSANKYENGDNSRRGQNAVFIGDPAARAVASAVAPWSTAGRGMVDIFA